MKRKLKNWKSSRSITDTADILDANPVSFNWRRKNNNDISTPTKNYLSKKFHEATTLSKQKYVEAVAPNQTDKFISQALNSSNQNSDEEEKVSSELREHLCAFKQCDFWEICNFILNWS